ncbi:hypothetical protein Taro_019641 [Colocasia esculenta]|uniref:DHHA1 domain-containing protein n=1 Tax=Colocasia esculenta TaxID=4460 RepID=A0A843UUB2_COLES|nr:hypothetical protein [Colocasia esculenta]
MINAWKRSAVLYHYPCPDGAFAALAAHLYFSAVCTPVVFFPNTVYDPIRVENIGCEHFDDVYLLDFVGPPGFVEELSSKAKSVTILDHHKTALEMFSKSDQHGGNVMRILDMERSGATIAYDFFRDKYLQGSHSLGHDVPEGVLWPPSKLVHEDAVERVNWLYKFIEDGDIWRWAIPESKAFYSGLKDMNIEYNVNENPSLFDQLLALDPELVISHGKATLSHKQKLIDEVLDQSYEIAIGGGLFGHCLAVNADAISDLRSDLGHQLAEKSHSLGLRGIGAVVYRVPELGNDHLLKVSLRSIGSEDTSTISQAHGGGGHRNASSFMLSDVDLEKCKV